MIVLDEEKNQKELEELKEEARKQTMETLPAFLKKITEDYQHDYGTIVHCCTWAMMGAFSAVDGSKQGGITGMQASFIGWSMVYEFMHVSKDSVGARLLDFDNLLYPQNGDKFEKKISERTWKALQEKAQKRIEEGGAAESVAAHWQSIVDGEVPFGYQVKTDG